MRKKAEKLTAPELFGEKPLQSGAKTAMISYSPVDCAEEAAKCVSGSFHRGLRTTSNNDSEAGR